MAACKSVEASQQHEFRTQMRRKPMKVKCALVCGTMLLLGVTAWAQEFPRAEVGVDYSYARYAPSAPYSKGHSLNGGGGELNINFNEYLSIKMDLQGYGSNITTFNIASNPTFPAGASGRVSGNLFTYLFGPQIKVRAHRFQPYGPFCSGGATPTVLAIRFIKFCTP